MPGSNVTLHIYDITSDLPPSDGSPTPLGTGAFHVAVEVHGKEWSYGRISEGSGLFHGCPTRCAAHACRRAVPVGETALAQEEVERILEEMRGDWIGTDYDLRTRNCCLFCDALCRKLGVGGIPMWVADLSLAGPGSRKPQEAKDETSCPALPAASGDVDVAIENEPPTGPSQPIMTPKTLPSQARRLAQGPKPKPLHVGILSGASTSQPGSLKAPTTSARNAAKNSVSGASGPSPAHGTRGPAATTASRAGQPDRIAGTKLAPTAATTRTGLLRSAAPKFVSAAPAKTPTVQGQKPVVRVVMQQRRASAQATQSPRAKQTSPGTVPMQRRVQQQAPQPHSQQQRQPQRQQQKQQSPAQIHHKQNLPVPGQSAEIVIGVEDSGYFLTRKLASRLMADLSDAYRHEESVENANSHIGSLWGFCSGEEMLACIAAQANATYSKSDP